MEINNVSNIRKKDCCGCSACSSICPVGAITMEADEEGFLYPKVNEKCINCGLCLKVCNSKVNLIAEKNNIKAYAAKNTDSEILKKSSSGGISHALSEHFIKNGGVVYGVVYDNNDEVIVEREDKSSGIEKLYGSKYVQANPRDTLKQVYDDLVNGKKVLYIATSCYIAGLKSYLDAKKCNQENIYTVDLICHGTPSPKLFKDYIEYLKQKYNFDHFEFRTKKEPWGYGSKNFGCTIYCKSGKQITDSLDSRLFLDLFFSNYCLRPHCHNCDFAKIEKPADITIADFWGCQNEHPEFFDTKGVSAVLVHSLKGEKLFKSIKGLTYVESSIEKVSKKQANLNAPSKVKEDREKFWNLYNKKGFKAVCKKYGNLNFKGKIKFSKMYKFYLKMKNG